MIAFSSLKVRGDRLVSLWITCRHASILTLSFIGGQDMQLIPIYVLAHQIECSDHLPLRRMVQSI